MKSYRLFLSILLFFLGFQAWAQLDQLEILEPEKPAAPAVESFSIQTSPKSSPSSGTSLPGQPEAKVGFPSNPVVFDPSGRAVFDLRYDFPEGFHQTKQEDFFGMTMPEASPFRILKITYPENGVVKEGLLNYYGSAVLKIEIGLATEVQQQEYRMPVTALYQLCDEAGTCYFPQEESAEIVFRIPEGTAVYEGQFSSGEKPVSGQEGGFPGNSAASASGMGTILRFLLFALIGGLLLNVMPCVLPVLSIRALNLVGQSNNKRKEIFTGSLLYTAGVLLSLLILAAAVIGLKLSGELVGWGFQFQNPLFVVFLITVIFVFGLSLFDVFVFQAPTMQGAVRKASQKGYIGSFFNGIIAVLLATPCTAPLLGTALGFAFSQSPGMIIGIFSMVGFGFALPFLLIGIWPAAVQKLPKPGPWMNTFKELMGFVLLATVIYLLSILRFQINPAEMIQVLIFLLVLGFLLWIYGKAAKPTASSKRKWIILALLIILSISAAGRLLQFDGSAEITESDSIREGWEVFSPEALETYRQEGQPVLVLFSAKWCTVCKLNEETVLHTDRANELFRDRDIRVLYGDYTNQDRTIGEWIQSYGRAGVPVYAYYPPGGSFQLLPEVLSMQVLESYLETSFP